MAVQAAGLNPSDTKIRAGGGSTGGVELPYVSGREAAGTVVEVGPGVDSLEPGQEVFAFFGWGARPGGHTERLVVAASALALSSARGSGDSKRPACRWPASPPYRVWRRWGPGRASVCW